MTVALNPASCRKETPWAVGVPESRPCDRRRSRITCLWTGEFQRNESGATAVEMAFIAPVFLALLLGIIQAGLLVYTKASLHYAVQKHVRCLAIQTSCPSATTYYFAPGTAPVFTPTKLASCQALTGTVTYSFNVVVVQQEVALSSTACFPRIIDAAA